MPVSPTRPLRLPLPAPLLGVLTCCVANAAPPPPAPVARDVGVPVAAVNWVRLHPGQTSDGRPSLLATMGQNRGGLFVLDIDPLSGAMRQHAATSPGAQYPIAAVRSARTGLLHVGSHPDGHLHRYDPARPDDGLVDLGLIDGDRATFPTGIAETPDGILWIGGYPAGSLTRFDPASGRFSPGPAPDSRNAYLYPLAGLDGTLAVHGKVVAPRVHLVDTATRETFPVGPVMNPEDKTHRLHLLLGLDGLLYLDSHAGRWRLRGRAAEPVEHLPPLMPGYHSTAHHAYQAVLPMPGGLVARWADGLHGAGMFRELVVSALEGDPPPRTLRLEWKGGGSNLWSLHRGPDGALYGSSFLPLHLFRHRPDTGELVNLGRANASLGQAYSYGNLADGRMIIAAYGGSMLSIYDPRRPMRYGTAPDHNPRDLGRLDAVGIRPVAALVTPPLEGPDGRRIGERFWIGSLPDYGLWGGTLAWLDPASGARASHRNLLEHCAPVALHWLPEQRRILVGLAGEGGTGTVRRRPGGGFALWDPVEDRADYAGDFGLAGLPDVVAFAPGPGRLVYALLGHSRHSQSELGGAAPRAAVALVDPLGRRVVTQTPLPESFGRTPDQVQFTLFAGPDGAAWGVTERVLYRVRPGTTTVDEIWRAESGGEINTPGPWFGRTFYFASGWRLRALDIP